MNITKSGFYKLSDEKVIISDHTEVVLFDAGNMSREVILGEGSKVKFFGVIKGEAERENIFTQEAENSELTIRYVLTSKNDQKIKARIFSKLAASFTKSDVQITSIVSEAGNVELDGSIQIGKGIVKADANLIEENLFLGSTGRIQGIPTLLVASDDVKAAHACRMEKISDDKLFYLRSRGVEKIDATYMMIESYINSMLGELEEIDSDFYGEIFNKIITEI